MSTLKKITAVALGTGTGIAAYYYQKIRQAEVHTSWTNSDEPVSACALWDTNWDLRDPKSLVHPKRNNSSEEENRYNEDIELAKPTAYRHLIFIRHGQYLDEGPTDETHVLTKFGRTQAEHVGKRLKEMGVQWDRVIVSTMMRAKETADIILENIDFDKEKLRKCSMLREGAPWPPQPPVGHWRPEEHQFFRDSVRIEAAFRQYFHRAHTTQKKDSYDLFIAHGNVIRYFVCRAMQLPPAAWLRLNVNHGSITWFQIAPSGNVQLKCLGDSGFMPFQYVTTRLPRKDGKNYL